MSAIAGLSFFNFYFQLVEGTIKSQQVIDFLGHLRRYLRRPLLIVWDGLSAHKSKITRDFHCLATGPHHDRISTGLRTGAESGRIHLGLLETA
jgi:hypothetical protein